MEVIKNVIDGLIRNKLTIATMESCTGGYITHLMTNVSGSSEVVVGGYVTYTTGQKINCGVSKEIINKFSVYSKECSKSMAFTVSKNTNASICIGITGKIGDDEGSIDVSYLFPMYLPFTNPSKTVTISKHYDIPNDVMKLNSRIKRKEYLAEQIFEEIQKYLNTFNR